MSGRTLVRGWPREFYRSLDPKGKCAICKNKGNPLLAIHHDCKKNHITCGICFCKYSWNEDTKAYECPKCIYEHFQQTNTRPGATLLEERMFVPSPDKGPNAFSYSIEAARKKAIREGRDPSMVIDREHVEKPPGFPASLKVESNDEDDDGPKRGSIFTRKISRVSSSSNSSISSSSSSSKSEVTKIRSDVSKSGVKRITYQGVEKEYAKVNVSKLDCDLCRCALCVDCIWEVVTK